MIRTQISRTSIFALLCSAASRAYAARPAVITASHHDPSPAFSQMAANQSVSPLSRQIQTGLPAPSSSCK
jgi:hypothetical protein